MNAYWLATILMIHALPATGATMVRLQRAPQQPDSLLPYGAAVLTIRNESERVVRRVSLRCRQGGPRFVHSLALAPKATASLSVKLPPSALHQVYDVQVYELDAPMTQPMAAAAAEIRWQPEDLRPKAFLDPQAYRPWHDRPFSWPQRLRRGLFLAAGFYWIVLGGCVLMRGRGSRLGTTLILAIAAAAGAWGVLSRTEVMSVREYPNETAPRRTGGHLLVLQCGRTVCWQSSDARLVPVYYSRDQMARDDTTIDERSGLQVTLRPGDVRLFRRPARGTSAGESDGVRAGAP